MLNLKKIVLRMLIVVATLTLLTACNDDKSNSSAKSTNNTASTVEQSVSIGLVDTDKVFTNSEAGKEAVKHLEGIAENLQKEFLKLQEELKGKEKDQTAIEKFQSTAAKLEEKFKAEEEQVMKTLEKVYQATLDNVRKNEKLQIVISKAQALSFEAERDITDKIIAEMNKGKVTFEKITENTPETKEEATTNSTEKTTNSTKK